MQDNILFFSSNFIVFVVLQDQHHQDYIWEVIIHSFFDQSQIQAASKTPAAPASKSIFERETKASLDKSCLFEQTVVTDRL